MSRVRNGETVHFPCAKLRHALILHKWIIHNRGLCQWSSKSIAHFSFGNFAVPFQGTHPRTNAPWQWKLPIIDLIYRVRKCNFCLVLLRERARSSGSFYSIRQTSCPVRYLTLLTDGCRSQCIQCITQNFRAIYIYFSKPSLSFGTSCMR